MPKPPDQPPSNVVRLVIEAPRRRAFLSVDVPDAVYAEFAALADSVGKTVEELLGEAMQHVFDKYGRPISQPGEIVRPSFPKPSEPEPC